MNLGHPILPRQFAYNDAVKIEFNELQNGHKAPSVYNDQFQKLDIPLKFLDFPSICPTIREDVRAQYPPMDNFMVTGFIHSHSNSPLQFG